jgi:hypothetical protein
MGLSCSSCREAILRGCEKIKQLTIKYIRLKF